MSLYKALNEEQLMEARFSLLREGEYDAIVKISTERMSSANNTMADMWVTVFDHNGASHDIRDFLVFTEKMLWKIKHFCDSAGLQKEYEEEKFVPEMAAGKNVRVLVGKQAGKLIPEDKLGDRPIGSCYPDKNVINDYVERLVNNAVPPMKRNNDLNDDIPF